MKKKQLKAMIKFLVMDDKTLEKIAFSGGKALLQYEKNKTSSGLCELWRLRKDFIRKSAN